MSESRRPGGFRVRETMCETCIYRPETPLDEKVLEDDCRDTFGAFVSHRACHHHPDRGEGGRCCRGFWDRHKGEFLGGQMSLALDMVDESNEGERKL